jgi:hypothetical protein
VGGGVSGWARSSFLSKVRVRVCLLTCLEFFAT